MVVCVLCVVFFYIQTLSLSRKNKEEFYVCTHAYDVPCTCISKTNGTIILSGALSDATVFHDLLRCQYTGALQTLLC